MVAMVSVSASLLTGFQGLGCLGPSFHVYTVGHGVSIQQQSRAERRSEPATEAA